MTATIAFPVGPIVDISGNLTTAGRFFLQGMFEKLGGSAGVGTDSVALSIELSAETTNRIAADNTLSAEIATEITDRQNAILIETQLRTAADLAQKAATGTVSNSLQIVAALAAPLDSPHFTGIPTAPTAAPGTNTDQLATTAFVDAGIAAAVEWNAGTVAAIDATQLQIGTGDTLQLITGATIKAVGSSAPVSIFDGVTASPSMLANTEFQVVGTVGTRLLIDAFGGNSQLSMRRINGTPASPTTIIAGNVIATLQGYGYDGTAFSVSQGAWQVNAINNWTTADHSTYHAWFATNSGSTTNAERMRLTGGALLVGATAVVGSEKLRISGQALADFNLTTPSAGLTAHAGGGQASALALTAGVNYVTTCATNGDSVRLPTSVAGLTVEVINAGAASCQVYGASTDTINNVATGTGVAVANGKTGYYRCAVAGKWFGGTLA